MLSWSTALSVTLPSPPPMVGLIGEAGGELVMLQLVCGRLSAGAEDGSPRGAVCGRLPVGDAAGDQGRWNWPGGRCWKGLGKRSGVEISREGSRWDGCATGIGCCGERGAGGGGGVRGGSSNASGWMPMPGSVQDSAKRGGVRCRGHVARG